MDKQKRPFVEVMLLLHDRWAGPSLGIRSKKLGFAIKIPISNKAGAMLCKIKSVLCSG